MLTVDLCCFATTVIWRWSICWAAVLSNLSRCALTKISTSILTHYLDILASCGYCCAYRLRMETNPQSTRYLTFLKGRVGRKVADFFMDFRLAKG
ncbi:nucleoid-associated protein [Escherichia coli]